MKQSLIDTVGSDYNFNKTAGTVVFSGITLSLNKILAIINTTRSEIIYNPTMTGLGGTFTGSTLTLDFDTTGHDDNDELFIMLDHEQSVFGMTTDVAIADGDGSQNSHLRAIAKNTQDGVITGPVTVSSATTLFSVDTVGYQAAIVQITSNAGFNGVTFETSNDNSTWTSVLGGNLAGNILVSSASVTGSYGFAAFGRYFRARISTYNSGSTTASLCLKKSPITNSYGTTSITGTSQVQGAGAHGATISGVPVRTASRAVTANPTAVTTGQTADVISTLVGVQITKPYSIPEGDWSYAAASGGIANTTTPVTLTAAGASGIRNYITSLQIQASALGMATEIAIRDGASGTVIWRMGIGTAGLINGISILFPNPIKSTAATLLEVVTLTATVTGSVYVNAQGYKAP